MINSWSNKTKKSNTTKLTTNPTVCHLALTAVKILNFLCTVEHLFI